jgi:hypothetical protein
MDENEMSRAKRKVATRLSVRLGVARSCIWRQVLTFFQVMSKKNFVKRIYDESARFGAWARLR